MKRRSRQLPLQRSFSLAALPILLMLDFNALPTGSPPSRKAPPTEKPAGQEFALRGQRAAREIKYSDWRKVCFKTPGTNTGVPDDDQRHI